jgi:hypothetical protein
MSLLRPLKRYRRKWPQQREWSTRDRLWREMGTALRGQLYVDRGGGPEDAVLVAGTARSGTSWISEVINHDNRYRIIHEPLRRGRLAITGSFRPRHYLRPGDGDPRFVRPMEAILSGRVRSLWTDKYNRKLVAGKRLVREVRGNLLLPWIRSAFPGTPVVLLLRHPCAVVRSQLTWGSAWPAKLERFFAERGLMEDHLEPFREAMAAASSEWDRHVFVWCVENYVPLRGLAPGQVHVVFYERLVVDPETELGGLFEFLGLDPTEEVLARLRRPSNSSRKDSAIVTGSDPVRSWRSHVSPADLRRAVEILRMFGLDRIYGDGDLPALSDPSQALIPG